MNKRTLIRACITLVVLGILIAWTYPKVRHLSAEQLVKYIPHTMLLALLVLVGLYLARIVFVVIPIALLYTAAGIMFSPVVGILITYLCVLLEINVGYWLGKRLGRDKVLAMAENSKVMQKITGSIESKGNYDCFILRILPVPFDVVSMMLSATGFPYGAYILYSMLGVTPCLIPFVLAGGSISDPLSLRFGIPFVISILVSTGAFFIMHNITRKERASALAAKNAERLVGDDE